MRNLSTTGKDFKGYKGQELILFTEVHQLAINIKKYTNLLLLFGIIILSLQSLVDESYNLMQVNDNFLVGTDSNGINQAQDTLNNAEDRITQCRQLIHAAAQPLTSVMTLLDLISTNPALTDDIAEDVSAIYEQALSLKQIFHQMQETMAGREVL